MKFYASVRLEVRRGKKLEKGDVTIGHELYLKVVKNKLAPPFRVAHTSLIYGKGIPTGVAVVDMAIDYGVINKKGAWLAYKGETLGQGKEAVAKFLSENKTLQDEIMKAIMSEVNKGIGFVPESSETTQGEEELPPLVPGEEPEELDNEDGILDISDSDSE